MTCRQPFSEESILPGALKEAAHIPYPSSDPFPQPCSPEPTPSKDLTAEAQEAPHFCFPSVFFSFWRL